MSFTLSSRTTGTVQASDVPLLELPVLNVRLISNALKTFLDCDNLTEFKSNEVTLVLRGMETVITVSQDFNTLYDLMTK